MMDFRARLLPVLFLLLFAGSCRGEGDTSGFPERFETGSKRSYATANVALASGTWQLDNALIGRSPEDRKDGDAALRIAPGGSATMLFDVALRSDTARLSLGSFGSDDEPLLALWCSTDGGTSWQRIGTMGSAAGASLQAVVLPLPHFAKSARFSIRNEGTGRVDADNFDPGGTVSVTSANTVGGHSESNTDKLPGTRHPAQHDDNMALGNPSGATAAVSNKNNYLLVHPQYTLAYNNSRGIAAWVSWHLSAVEQGNADRCNCFAPDAALPAQFYHAVTSAYLTTGFDRGHLCPSGDRSATDADNAATFLLANIAPQAPLLNEQTWERLEAYCRTLTQHSMELYIIAGSYGTGGEGRNGGTTNTIAGGRITVPAHFWKIVVVLPVGEHDINRITAATRVIAVDMPNVQSVSEHTWNYYRTTIAKIEAATEYKFLSNLPKEVRTALRIKTDGGLRAAE